ncbi:hypothetical protein THAOC_24575, partial [Thalassiosira oceanica]
SNVLLRKEIWSRRRLEDGPSRRLGGDKDHQQPVGSGSGLGCHPQRSNRSGMRLTVEPGEPSTSEQGMK